MRAFFLIVVTLSDPGTITYCESPVIMPSVPEGQARSLCRGNAVGLHHKYKFGKHRSLPACHVNVQDECMKVTNAVSRQGGGRGVGPVSCIHIPSSRWYRAGLGYVSEHIRLKLLTLGSSKEFPIDLRNK